MDELAYTIGYLVISVAAICLGIWAISVLITGIVYTVMFIGRLFRRRSPC